MFDGMRHLKINHLVGHCVVVTPIMHKVLFQPELGFPGYREQMTVPTITQIKMLTQVDSYEKNQDGTQNGIQFSEVDNKNFIDFLEDVLPVIKHVQQRVREGLEVSRYDCDFLARVFEAPELSLNPFDLCQLARNCLVELAYSYADTAREEMNNAKKSPVGDESKADMGSSLRLFAATTKILDFENDRQHMLVAPNHGLRATTQVKHSFKTQAPVKICSFSGLDCEEPVRLYPFPEWAEYQPSSETDPSLVKQSVLAFLNDKQYAEDLAKIDIHTPNDYKNLSLQQAILLSSFILESRQDQNREKSAALSLPGHDVVSGKIVGVCRHVTWALIDVFEVLKGLQSRRSTLRNVYCINIPIPNHLANAFVWNTKSGLRAFQLDAFWEDRMDEDTPKDSVGSITTLRDSSNDPSRLAPLYYKLGQSSFRSGLIHEYFPDLIEPNGKEIFESLVYFAKKFLDGDDDESFLYMRHDGETITVMRLLWYISKPVFNRLLAGVERKDVKRLLKKHANDPESGVGTFLDAGLEPGEKHYRRLMAIQDPTARAALFQFTSEEFQDWVKAYHPYPYSILLKASLSHWPRVRYAKN